ncbi:sensor histidine kinase [Alkalibacter saccharofermentans]|nr:ATP-binding protein [Alkalibacter saccharofermentans]
MNKRENSIIGNLFSGLEYLLRLPMILIDNITRILKFSIRTKITLNYILLYSVSALLTAALVSGGYLLITRNQIYERNRDYINEALGAVSQHESNVELQQELEHIYEESGINILVTNAVTQESAATTQFYPVVNYQFLTENNPLYKSFSIVSLLSYDLIALEASQGEYSRVVFFFNVEENIHTLKIVLILMSFGYILGLLMILVLGDIKLRRVLNPIKKISKSAKNINTQNLDTRIDVGRAKYELKDLAITINEMIDRIQDGYRKQQRFVSDVSHELRTPISVINGYANMLDRWGKNDPEILQESIDAMKNEAGNMSDLVEKLLFLARHDRDALKYEITEVNLSEIVEEVAKETAMIDSEHDICADLTSGIWIEGDPNRIKQVIRIFVDNAVKYTPEGKKIQIRAFIENEFSVVEITDAGIGISKDDLDNIFERFYRADESRTKTTGGYGLGLSIAKVIVLQHGGKIKVRTKPGIGSRFSIYLPTLSRK